MAGFWRNRRTDLTGPAKYIQTTDRVSRPLSVLLSLVVVCLVVAVLSGLYFGGKWAVDTLSDNDTPSSTTAQQPTAPSIEGGVTATTPTASTTSSQNGSSSTQSTANPDTSKGSVRASVAASAAVPNTGPEGVIVVFIGSFIVGVLGYRSVAIRRLS